MCTISADSEDSSQIFFENSYISAKCLEIIYRYFTDRRKPTADNCSAVTYMLQIFADIQHICQFGKGIKKELP